MNEKIKELYKQASKQDYFLQDDEEVYMSAGDLEKFAELIIKECIDVINSDIKYNQLILHNDNSYKIHNMASLTGVIGKIKNHFSVEE